MVSPDEKEVMVTDRWWECYKKRLKYQKQWRRWRGRSGVWIGVKGENTPGQQRQKIEGRLVIVSISMMFKALDLD